jgi:hypothetical protein
LQGLVFLFYCGLPPGAFWSLHGLGIGGRLVVYGDKYIVNKDVRIINGDLVIINNVLENLL